MTPSEFDALYIARIRALRDLSGKTQREMALALGIEHEAYKKYEKRSPMPLALVERFAVIVGYPVEFVVTGRKVRGRSYPNVPGPEHVEKLRNGVAPENVTAE